MQKGTPKEYEQKLFFLQKRTGYSFNDPGLLKLAFTTRSNEGAHMPSANNERLEFLGDAALDLIIGEDLYKEYPDADEGFMTIERSKLACGQNLAAWGYEAGFDMLLRTGDDVGITRSRLEDSLEAVAGAYYLDGGLEAVRSLLQSFSDYPDQGTGFDARRHLARNCTAAQLGTPKYSLTRRRANGKVLFECEITLDKSSVGTGLGDSEDEARRNAARDAMKNLCRTTPAPQKRPLVLRARRRIMQRKFTDVRTLDDAQKEAEIARAAAADKSEEKSGAAANAEKIAAQEKQTKPRARRHYGKRSDAARTENRAQGKDGAAAQTTGQTVRSSDAAREEKAVRANTDNQRVDEGTVKPAKSANSSRRRYRRRRTGSAGAIKTDVAGTNIGSVAAGTQTASAKKMTLRDRMKELLHRVGDMYIK